MKNHLYRIDILDNGAPYPCNDGEYVRAEDVIDMMKWQPIETAPRDGTYIDIWSPRDGRVTEVFWDTEGDDWVSLCTVWSGNPTHWMPLPEPPEGE